MNDAGPSHPSTEQLTNFALGKVNDAELESISKHLSECPACCDFLAQCDPHDDLMKRLDGPDPRLHPAAKGAGRPRAGVRLVRQLLQGEDTAAEEADAAEKADAVDLDWLQPAGRSDALGRLGHYDILEVLGRGGFGIVFRAHDEVLQRVVAIKLLDPELAVTSPARKRFLREARAAAQVRHENVVQIHAVEEQPLPYLVMEFIPGETLQQRLDRTGPLDAAEVAQIGRQIAEGLAAAHAVGMIHRDVKPANILLEAGPRLRVKLTDFGLARAADDASLTRSGVVAGTPMYMSPEQARGDTLDPRSDLFSLGSVLYAVVSGRPPFRAESALAVLKRVTEETPRPIPEIVPETPAWLCDLIARLMAKNPAERIQTAAAAAEALATGLTAPLPVVPPPARRHRFLWASGVLLLAAVLALTALVWPRTDPDSKHGVPDARQLERLAAPYKNSLGMTFVLVPRGKSWLGGGGGTPGDKEAEIPQDFYLGKYEVTQGDWGKVMGNRPSAFGRAGGGANAVADVPDEDLWQFPVESVSWDDAQLFLVELNKHDRVAGWTYRLPTEAEWEYACRGGPLTDRLGSSYHYYFEKPTDQFLEGQAQLSHGDKPLQRTCKVGSYPPNKLGLCDMHGNVFELCADEQKQADGASLRVVRGGCWNNYPDRCTATFRYLHPPGGRGDNIGLRLARVPVGK